MRHLDILLPFGLPAPEFAADLLPELHTPALSMLLARAMPPVNQAFDPFAHSLPHEVWLAGQLQLGDGLASDSSPALAVSRMRSLGLTAQDGVWFLLQPVHIHIARDQLMLTDPRRLTLSDLESRALFDSALPLFQHAGKDLLYGSADTWFVRADDWRALQTATPDAAGGRNIDIWMPKGEGERAWRKLQNEVHLEWHEHAINSARAEQGLAPINSLWLWGAADAGLASMPADHAQAAIAAAWLPLSALLSSMPDSRLLILDDLSEAALAADWARWLAGMHALEEKWYAPVLGALQAGQLNQIKLIFGNNILLRTFVVNKLSLLKFWSKPSLARLMP